MKIATTTKTPPPPMQITPAMMAAVRQLARFDDPFLAALARQLERRAREQPHLLRRA